jgi:hypothetical protein
MQSNLSQSRSVCDEFKVEVLKGNIASAQTKLNSLKVHILTRSRLYA